MFCFFIASISKVRAPSQVGKKGNMNPTPTVVPGVPRVPGVCSGATRNGASTSGWDHHHHRP